jgi:CBS domain containing-hemolysin-like protein
MSTIGRIPVEGDSVLLPYSTGRDAVERLNDEAPVRWEATVDSMDNRRVDKVTLRPVPHDPASQDGDSE